jgi:hypothetical protein
MVRLLKVAVFCMVLVMSFSLISCSEQNDAAITVCKEFIKKAATGDKTLKDIVDFDMAAQKYGTTKNEIIKREGAEKWDLIKDDMITTITTAFGQFKDNYSSAFSDFKIESKGADYWIVSYINPAKERRAMMVRKIDATLKTYYYNQ